MPTYFESCYNLLKPGGKMAFQVITTPNKNYEIYRRGCDFIQKYIFPGSLCPSINAVLDAVEKKSKFAVLETENIGYHYARTLKEWRVNFLANKQQLLDLGFDEVFIRKWVYYFSYCEAGFGTEYLGDYQVVLSTPRYLLE
jgi:cyclopropane-fatty-acyl-phospholipid synthase